MADNVQLNLGSGGVLAAADDLGAGVWIQRVKPAWGPDGSAADASASNPLPVKANMGATPSVAAVAQNAASTTLLASNASRQSARIYNDSPDTLYVKYGAAATKTTSYTDKLLPQQSMRIDDYTGLIAGIWEQAGAGNALVTEVTP